jgi:hypothetical protein
MRERLDSTRVLTMMGMVAVAAFLALTAQVAGPAGPAAAQLASDPDDTCDMRITKTNDTGGNADLGETFTWEIEIEWDDDCSGESFDVADNIPSGFSVEDVTDGSNINCDDSDPIDCDGTVPNGTPGTTFVNIDVEAGGTCSSRTNTATLDWSEGDDSDSDSVDVDCDNDEICDDEDELDELDLDEDELDELCGDDEDEDTRVVVVRRTPVFLPAPGVAVPAIAPAPAPPPTAVAAAAPVPAPAPVVQLPRAGEGPAEQGVNPMLPIGAGLLIVAGMSGLVYLRMSRFS